VLSQAAGYAGQADDDHRDGSRSGIGGAGECREGAGYVVGAGGGEDGHDGVDLTANSQPRDAPGHRCRGCGGAKVERIPAGSLGRVRGQHVDPPGVTDDANRFPAGRGWSTSTRAASASTTR
jgi:hypothetical protein